MYDLNELKTFVSVMETGNLKDSAQALGVSKSTLSRRINHLETVLNQPLLRRQANRLIANEAGLQFLPFAKKMLAIADDGLKAVEDLKGEVTGKLTVYVHNILIRGWFSNRMFEFLDKYPGVNMEVKTGNNVSQGSSANDVSIWVGKPTDEGLKAEKIGQLTQGVYASPRYLEERGEFTHPSELNQCAWVDMIKNDENSICLDNEKEGRVCFSVPDSRLIVDQFTLHVDAMIRGNGVGILPHYLVDMRARHHADSLVNCLPDWRADPMPVYIQYPYGHLPKKLQVLINYLKEESQHFY
ncbi:LysR family transcriptional regulator [Marinomonas pollencensis]|uniref:DNA-binding transcriptional LysR family regulator n=1 Tax=Marinomonas pollencensis TaxID=491954 RepID=A0A3E0DPQ9_9GAMM|nr:LysR family transcriptional regulator [Marinomonas pollencensis]REG84947.1 DNA-binding transcriptional LysR family regulator [Marinomonas pollencensis]